MTSNAFQPMDLGEIFANTVALIKRTLSSSALLSIVIVIILGIIFGYGMRNYLTGMSELAASGMLGEQDDPEIAQQMMPQLMGAVISVVFSTSIYLIGLLFVQVMTAIGSWEAMNGRVIGVGELFRRSLSRPFWISLLQSILLAVVLMAAFFILLIVAYILSGGNEQVLQVVVWLVMLPFLYPIIATIFRVHKVAIEERGPWQGMIASIAMVKGSWWRTFGILMLAWLGIGAISFLISFAVGGGTMPSFSGSMSTQSDPEAQAAALAAAREAYTWPAIIASAISGGILFTFFFYLLTPMYVDLRARRGDFYIEEGGEGYEEGGYEEEDEGV